MYKSPYKKMQHDLQKKLQHDPFNFKKCINLYKNMLHDPQKST